jgi:hypothetical protein
MLGEIRLAPLHVPLDHLEELEDHAVDALGFHARQVQPELVQVLLAQVPEQKRAVRGLRPREVGVEHGATVSAAVTFLGVAHEYRRSSRRTPLTHAYPGGGTGLVAVAFPLHDFKGLRDDGAGFS